MGQTTIFKLGSGSDCVTAKFKLRAASDMASDSLTAIFELRDVKYFRIKVC